jgi:hypothetical protein
VNGQDEAQNAPHFEREVRELLRLAGTARLDGEPCGVRHFLADTGRFSGAHPMGRPMRFRSAARSPTGLNAWKGFRGFREWQTSGRWQYTNTAFDPAVISHLSSRPRLAQGQAGDSLPVARRTAGLKGVCALRAGGL